MSETIKLIRVTYDIVTPESAKVGDYEESGWIDEDGIDVTPDDWDIEEADGDYLEALLKNVFRQVPRYAEQCNNNSYQDCEYRTNYRTGAVESRTYHLVGFTPKELEAIAESIRIK